MFHRNRLFFLALLTISLSGRIECDEPSQLDLDKLRDSINIDDINKNSPAGMEIPVSFKNITLPKIENSRSTMKEKCKTVSGSEEAYKAVEIGAAEFLNCISGSINGVFTLKNEIDKAQSNAELDTVFNTFCRKLNIVIGCLENISAVIEPCLEPKEIERQSTIVKYLKNGLNFACYKDGNQIALFFAEEASQCFIETKDELINCMNATFFKYLPSEKEIELIQSQAPQIPQLVLDQEQCNDMDSVQGCVVKSLEKCKESTANLVESLFNHFWSSEAFCGNMTASESYSTVNANTQTVSIKSLTLIASLLELNKLTVKK